jgi:hypothetical protein
LESFDAIPLDVAKIAATLSIGLPKDSNFSQPMQAVLSRGISSALDVLPKELSYFSSSESNGNASRRLREGAVCQDADIVHHVSYEVVAPSSRKQETFEAAQNIAVAGTEAYSKLSSVLSVMSGFGEILPCTEEIAAPVLFMDQIIRAKNGSIVSMSQTQPVAVAVAAAPAREADNGEGLEWWVILLVALGGVCLCCICSICQTRFILKRLKERHEQDIWRVPSASSIFRTISTPIGKQIPKSPRQPDKQIPESPRQPDKQIPRSPRQPETPRSNTGPALPVLLSGLASSSEGKRQDAFKWPAAPSRITWKRATPDNIIYHADNADAV